MQVGNSGFIGAVSPLSPFARFSIWFTTQDVFIYGPGGASYSQVTMPGISDLASLFDEIMLDAVEMTMHCSNDAQTFGTSQGSGVMILATDYNDNNAPGTGEDVQQYRDCKAIPLRSDYIHKQVIKPKYCVITNTAGGSTDAARPTRGYLRGNTQIPHNGLKGAFLLSPNNGTIVFSFKFRYKCKTAK